MYFTRTQGKELSCPPFNMEMLSSCDQTDQLEHPRWQTQFTSWQQLPDCLFFSVLKVWRCAHKKKVSVCLWEKAVDPAKPPRRRTHYRLCVALQGGVSFHKWEQETKWDRVVSSTFTTFSKSLAFSSTWIVSQEEQRKKNDSKMMWNALIQKQTY